jgi:hypothetical protein
MPPDAARLIAVVQASGQALLQGHEDLDETLARIE